MSEVKASTNYRRLKDTDDIAALYRGWLHPDIPARQYMIVDDQLRALRHGYVVQPFNMLQSAFVRCHDPKTRQSVIEIGCASGYNAEVLNTMDFRGRYYGVDYSPEFINRARTLYPECDFDVADAHHVPVEDRSFDIVIDGGCLLHVQSPIECIKEAFRVSKRYVIYHRIPLTIEDANQHWVKEAYGVEVAETYFNRRWLEAQFSVWGRVLLWTGDLNEGGSGTCTYLLEKYK